MKFRTLHSGVFHLAYGADNNGTERHYMTYIDDKYKKSSKSAKTKKITYKTPEKKRNGLVVALFVLLAIVGVIVLIGALSMDKKNSENGVSRQESKEITKADDDRKKIVASVITSLADYQANNRGSSPSSSDGWSTFWSKYVGTPTDSTGVSYKLAAACTYGEQNSKCVKPSSLSWKDNKQEIYIVAKATCNSDGTDIEPVNRARSAAVYTVLSNDKITCASN